jgi:membrane dipeptidase
MRDPGQPPPPLQPLFDGHNDLLSHLWADGDGSGRGFFAGREGAVDLAKCQAGGLAGGFFAIWVPGGGGRAMRPIAPDAARATTFGMAATLRRMAATEPAALRLCTSAAGIAAARAAGAVAAVMHLEGAEAIGEGLDELEILHAAGLRSLGPVWSRPNRFGHGVPFAHPASPDTGPGLTEAGRRLVAACHAMRILVDLSHLNEAGFWDVAAIAGAPLVATHSNAHAISPSARNLTDRQLAAIAESGGLVGLNLAVQFLRPDGRRIRDTGLALAVRHLEHLLERLGEGGVALGTDLDGAMVPAAVGTAAGLPALVAAMRAAGFGEDLVDRICWRNWQALIARVIG